MAAAATRQERFLAGTARIVDGRAPPSLCCKSAAEPKAEKGRNKRSKSSWNQYLRPAQNPNFKPSCMMRGSRADVTTPNVLELISPLGL